MSQQWQVHTQRLTIVSTCTFNAWAAMCYTKPPTSIFYTHMRTHTHTHTHIYSLLPPFLSIIHTQHTHTHTHTHNKPAQIARHVLLWGFKCFITSHSTLFMPDAYNMFLTHAMGNSYNKTEPQLGHS